MKRTLVLVLLVISALLLVSCDLFNGGDDTPDTNYPEGSIAITNENFYDYFDLKVSAKDNWYEHGSMFNAYVAIVPKGYYTTVLGEVTFTVNSYVYETNKDVPNFRIVTGEQSLLLGTGVVNESYTLRIQNDGDYKVNSDSNTVTLHDVYGYIIPGEKKPSEYESLTDTDKANSASVLTELKAVVEEWKPSYEAAESYNFYRESSYYYASIYGEELSVKTGSSAVSDTIVDKLNQRCERNGNKYYAYADATCVQRMQSNGMVSVSRDGLTLDYLYETSAFDFEDMFDSSAVYVKTGDGSYAAYTTLYNMQDGKWKENFKDDLDNWGITTRHDRFLVKYLYTFYEGSFDFSVEIDYLDYQYHVDYYDISAVCRQKISDIDHISVKLYTPEDTDFMLCNDLDNAMATNAGLIEIDGSTKEISYTLYNGEDAYEGWTSPPYENYLPIRITEGGVYYFSEDFTNCIYDASGERYFKDYFHEGVYYIENRNVVYGLSEKTVTIDSLILGDYGDLSNPVEITDGSFDCYLEAKRDMQAFSFTPDEDGYYELSDCENLYVAVYAADDTENATYHLYSNSLVCKLEGGVEYIFAIENYYLDAPISYEGNISYAGAPTESPLITAEWGEVFLGGVEGEFIAYVDIPKAGAYRIEVKMIAGDEVKSGRFYTEDGESIDSDYYTYEDEIYTYELAKGRYQVRFSAQYNSYIKANMRLVTVTEGVEEQQDITLPTDGYITITTSALPTVHSTSAFKLTVDDKSKLLITQDSDFFSIYDSEGNRVSISSYPYYTDTEFENIQVEHSNELAAGEYYIVFERTIYSYDREIFSATVRLLPVE